MLNAPSNPTAHADQLFQRGDYAGAVRAYLKILKIHPRNADLLHRLAIAEAQIGHYDDAIRNLERAIRLRPSSAQFLTDLGQALIGAHRYDDAERAYDRALAADPSFTFVHGARAELFQLTGDFDKARHAIEAGLAANSDDPRLALAYAKLAPRLDAERRAIELLERHLARGLPTTDARMTMLFRLADQHDRLGEHDRAFELYRQANDLSPHRFSPERHQAAVDQMIAGWSRRRLEAIPRASHRSELPVFVLGMPRSGTSLVEQILACHPGVHGGGELPEIPKICIAMGAGMGRKERAEALPRLPLRQALAGASLGQEPMLVDPSGLTRHAFERQGRTYLGALHKLGPHAKRVTDKLPSNFLHLGLIDRMLPGARVIHCTRDPLDTCLSCYFQHFLGSFPWSYKLEWLGAYYKEYQRVMDHWTSVLTDLPMLEVPYEQLVADQERWSRRIIDFAGLEWDDACLRFHESTRVTATLSNEQVRRPMYRSSVQRHRNYHEHLAPLRRALAME